MDIEEGVSAVDLDDFKVHTSLEAANVSLEGKTVRIRELQDCLGEAQETVSHMVEEKRQLTAALESKKFELKTAQEEIAELNLDRRRYEQQEQARQAASAPPMGAPPTKRSRSEALGEDESSTVVHPEGRAHKFGCRSPERYAAHVEGGGISRVDSGEHGDAAIIVDDDVEPTASKCVHCRGGNIRCTAGIERCKSPVDDDMYDFDFATTNSKRRPKPGARFSRHQMLRP
eukprot:GFYU01024819.1.p1 GENE.GFYU01024819.1~~GFYU01024819.1.p1  ORF type:complete len:240 (-),score=42.56 GFYU01024819.1:60-749(-)